MLSSRRELSATPGALLAAIDRYESCLAPDLSAETFLQQTRDSFEEVRLGAAAFAPQSALWVEVLITRFEVLEALLKSSDGRRTIRTQALLKTHREHLERLRGICRSELDRGLT